MASIINIIGLQKAKKIYGWSIKPIWVEEAPILKKHYTYLYR